LLKIRQGSCRVQRGHADRHTYRERAVWRTGPEEMAIRRVERRRDAGQLHGVGRRTRVMKAFVLLCSTAALGQLNAG